ncbi:MAG: DeoR/GlpR family DNA-binding transcription regulator [Acidimicrobiia bacterium]
MSEHSISPTDPDTPSRRKPAMVEDSAMVEERRRLLVEAVNDTGRVVASQEADRFGVSEDTIRRDLRFLASQGLVQRVRGGALPVAPAAAPYQQRVADVSTEVTQLALRTAEYLSQAGGVIVLDGGATNLLVAEALEPSPTMTMTVVTNSPGVGAAATNRGIPTLMLGGLIDPTLGAAVDATATQALAGIRADKVVLGACAVHPDSGVSTTRADEVEFKRGLVAAGGEVIVVATHDKLMTAAPYVVAGTDAIDVLIAPAASDGVEFADTGVEVLHV